MPNLPVKQQCSVESIETYGAVRTGLAIEWLAQMTDEMERIGGRVP